MRDYTKIQDLSKLPASQQPFLKRNIRIAELFIEGKRSVEVARIIFNEFDEFVSTSRLSQIRQVWTPYVLYQAEKGGK